MKLRPVSYDKSVQVMLEVKSTHVETKNFDYKTTI